MCIDNNTMQTQSKNLSDEPLVNIISSVHNQLFSSNFPNLTIKNESIFQFISYELLLMYSYNLLN